MGKPELPENYLEAEEWAKHFLKRMKALRKRYQEDEYMRKYFPWGGSSENAAVKRASMDLSKALVKIRKQL